PLALRITALERLQRTAANHRNLIAREVVLRKKLANLKLDKVDQLLVVDHVALVQKHHDVGHVHLTRKQNVLARLRHGTIRGTHHQNRTVHLRRTRDHVLHVVGVTRTVHVSIVASIRLVLHVRRRNRDPTLTLLRRLVDVVVRNVLRKTLRSLNRSDRSRQRRLAVVHVTNRAHVHVRLRTLKLRLRHDSLPRRSLEWLALDLGDDLFRLRPRDLFITRKLHRVHGPPLGQGAQRRRVPEHLRQRDARADDLRVATLRHPADLATAARDIADHVAHVVRGGDDLHVHDRLEEHRIATPGALLQRDRPGDLERHLARVDVVVRTVDQLDLHVDHRVAGEDAALHRLLHPLLDRADVLARDHAAHDPVLEDESGTRLRRLDVDHDVAVLAPAAGLADELALDVLRRAANRLAVRDLRTADVRIDLELPAQTVDQDLEVQLAHPGDDRLPGLRVQPDTEGRILLGQLAQPRGELVLIRLRLRLDRDLDHRLREAHRLQDHRVVRIAERVARARVAEPDRGRDVAREDLLAP